MSASNAWFLEKSRSIFPIIKREKTLHLFTARLLLHQKLRSYSQSL